MILVDADAYIGWMVSNDAHHDRVVKIFRELRDDRERLVTSWDVVSEVATKLSYFTTKAMSVRFLRELFASDTKIVYVDEKLGRVARKIFVSLRSKRASMTDCVNMAIARSLRIKKFFSFDEIYRKNGFELVGENELITN
ncbi:PIN domain-containing protein [Patescibacteria group bacterium]|nr:PIN domain-containing protein [Patescibacteria group bacterium]